MQIHNNTLIAECSAYDFKEMLERKKVKSWLKSVSAFANTDGGSLFVSIRPRACFSPSYNKVKSQTKHVWLLTLL